MASEINAISGNREGNQYTVVMIFPLDSAKIKQVNAANVVPTPSSDLLPLETAIVDAAHKTALDGGTSLFRRVTIPVLDGDTGATLRAKVEAEYTRLKPLVQAAYDKTYKYIGTKLNAPA